MPPDCPLPVPRPLASAESLPSAMGAEAQAAALAPPTGPTPSLALRSLASVWHPCTQMQRAQAQPPLALVAEVLA